MVSRSLVLMRKMSGKKAKIIKREAYKNEGASWT